MVEQLTTYGFLSPAGMLQIKASDRSLVALHFISNDPMQPRGEIKMNELPDNIIIYETVAQLKEYFAGSRIDFSIPLRPEGTEFQLRVWEKLTHIPYARTISYQQLAILLGDPKCIRAAGTANGRNPIAIIIPCHRVIGSNGSMVGYGGGVWRKQFLLALENRIGNGAAELFD
ncbi:methylated-DNA--[protein]-cysteine S-methyltransferase [Pollutibacter soli]|uniref:methylated-DNA--[protein]-cysteine S-methyltransferase n=1 Tax=Pollutibacter soli TaxID=3034157 RepID=UPI003013D1C2